MGFTLNERNEWTYTYEDLPKYADGSEIEYSVVELNTEEDGNDTILLGTDTLKSERIQCRANCWLEIVRASLCHPLITKVNTRSAGTCRQGPVGLCTQTQVLQQSWFSLSGS